MHDFQCSTVRIRYKRTLSPMTRDILRKYPRNP
jgi:hypothetical protein